MMNPTLFYAPAARYLLPFMGGILIQYNFSTAAWIFIAALSISVVFLLLDKCLKMTWGKRWISGCFAYLACFAMGSALTYQACRETEWSPSSSGCYEAVLQDTPSPKKQTVLCRVKLSSGKRALVYLPKDSTSLNLVPGTKIHFCGRLEAPSPSNERLAFDYSSYLRKQGYAATGFIKKGQWKVCGYEFNLKYKALACRDYLTGVVKDMGLSDDAYAFGAAMLLGSRDLMSDELETSFAVAGISHVISISGLHTQIIFMMFVFLLGFMGNSRKVRIVRLVIILICMWVFTFISGLSPSVVRASAMLSLYGIGEMLSKKTMTLNVVYVSAFLMLAYNPLYLFDISFQLSYLAVLAIVVVYPMMEPWHTTENKIVKYLWTSFCISVVAQLATAPLCLYYFHTFPVYSWFSNVVLAPLVGPALIGMIIALPIHSLFALPAWCYLPVDWALQAIIQTAKAVEQLPFAVLKGFYPDEIQTLLSYGIIVSAICFLHNRRIRTAYLFQLFVLLQVIYYF